MCGKGTYIRSLARDLGGALGCGGVLRTLRRTAVGPFTLDDAMTYEQMPPTMRLDELRPPSDWGL